MATAATYLKKLDSTCQTGRSEEFSSGGLRALPFEELHFHTKRIDNSRLVRQADPRESGRCWSTIGAVSAVAIVLITTLAPGVAGVMAGYQLESLKQEQQKLLNEQRTLEVEEARLLSADRLEELAKEQKMVTPASDQVFHLDAEEGTVAQLQNGVE
jgi:cell division protein FtsL